MPQGAPPAFFSYCREDAEFALRLAGDLKGAGASVWMDQLDISPGQRWDRAVEDALAKCRSILVILSPTSVSSTNVMDEVSFALEENKTVIPVIYKDCAVPFRLRRLQYVDFRQDYAHGLKELLRTLAPEQKAGQSMPAISDVRSQSHTTNATEGDEREPGVEDEVRKGAERARLDEERKRTAAQARLEQERKQNAELARVPQQRKEAVERAPVEQERQQQPYGSLWARIQWLRRNWKWALLAWLAFFLSIIGLVFFFLGSSEVSKLAFAQARSSPDVVQRLGEPMKRGWVTSGSIETSGSSGKADLAIPISGPKGNGTLYAVATESAGHWTFETLQLALEASGERIDLLRTAAPTSAPESRP